jgi:hypothetical protein
MHALILTLVVAPTIFFMFTWVVVTTWRLLYPEQPLPMEKDPVILRERARERGEVVPVCFSDIRMDQRRYQRQVASTYEYDSGELFQQGLPPYWLEDVHRRCN